MITQNATTPLQDLAALMGLSATLVGTGLQGGAHITTNEKVDGVIVNAGSPSYIAQFAGGISVAGGGAASLLPIPALEAINTDEDGNDFLQVSQVQGSRWSFIPFAGGAGPVSGIRLATKLIHPPVITAYNYAIVGTDDAVGEFQSTPTTVAPDESDITLPETSAAISPPTANGLLLALSLGNPADVISIDDTQQNSNAILLTANDFSGGLRIVIRSPRAERTYTFTLSS